MSFIKSVFCGNSGQYNVCGVDVHFTSGSQFGDVFQGSFFGSIVQSFCSNSVCRTLSLGYLHIFVHEMGHALAARKVQSDCKPQIHIYTNVCQGISQDRVRSRSTADRIWIRVAGPLAAISLELVKIVSAIALGILFPSFIGISLAACFGLGSLIWLLGEVAYMFAPQGDWAEIRKLLSKTKTKSSACLS